MQLQKLGSLKNTPKDKEFEVLIYNGNYHQSGFLSYEENEEIWYIDAGDSIKFPSDPDLSIWLIGEWKL